MHALVAAGVPKEAANYVPKCDASKRVALFVECGEWIAAGKECLRKGDRDELALVIKFTPSSLSQNNCSHLCLLDSLLRAKCTNSILAAQLDALLDEMRNGTS